MSNRVFDREDFVKSVPEEILTRTKENMEEYHMTLCDAFQEAVKELAEKGTELWNAWCHDDFRAYIPCVYEKQYLDFEKYPLKYNRKRLFADMDGMLAVFRPVETLETLYEEGYFLNLEPHRNVVEAVKEIVSNYPDIEVFIMSAYLSDSKYALKEKNEWLDAYLPEIDAAHRIFPPCGTDKKEYVPGGIREDDFLWDDYTKNLSLWEPPARGIKLLNGINHTKGTWQKDCLSFEKSGEELAKNINEIMMNGICIKDKTPGEKVMRPWQSKYKEDKTELLKSIAEYDWPYENFLGDIFASGFKMEDIYAAEILDDYVDYWTANVTGMSLPEFTGLTKEERKVLQDKTRVVEGLNILRSKEANYLQQKNIENAVPRKRGR